MPILLGIDLETTGLDPKLGHITEIGVALYDTETQMLFNPMGLLVNDATPDTQGRGWVISEELVYLSGIHPNILLDHGSSLAQAFAFVHKLALRADCIVAHNADFEKAWLLHHVPTSPLLTMPLIDTLTDLPYSPHQKHKDLERLCLKHSVPYPHMHRAMFDVVAMLDVLKCYPFDKVLERSCSPSVTLQAMVSFEQKDLAKAIGYGWDDVKRIWTKTIKELDLQAERERATLAGFEVAEIV